MTQENPKWAGIYMVRPTWQVFMIFQRLDYWLRKPSFKSGWNFPVPWSQDGIIFINNKSVPINFFASVFIFIFSWVEMYTNTTLRKESGEWGCFGWKLSGLAEGVTCCCNYFLDVYSNIVYQAKALSVDATKNYSQREFMRKLSFLIESIRDWIT